MILVYNANGTTGSGVVGALVAQGHAVRAVVRDAERARTTLPPGVEVIAAPLLDPAGLERVLPPALAGVHAMYVATPACPELPAIERALGRAAAAAGVARIAKLGGIRVEDESIPPLMGKLHARGWAALRDSGVPVVHLRAGFYMQNLLMAAGAIRSGVLPATTRGAKMAFVDARDLARCAAAVLTEDGHDGKSYDLTGPVGLSFHDVAAILGEVLHREVACLDVDDAAFRAGAIEGGAPAWVVDRLLELYDHVRTTDFAAAPTDAVQRLTGRAPIDLARFVLEHRAAFD